MRIFLNLLAGTTGGQVTRATAFLDRITKGNTDFQLIVVKPPIVLKEFSSMQGITFVNIDCGSGQLKLLRRLFWETFKLPLLIKKYNADIFLTFSHFLPYRKFNVPTFVGVSNLAPFSIPALSDESFFKKLKLIILRKTILSSVRRADAVMALSFTAEKVLTEFGVSKKKIIVIPIGVDSFWSIPVDSKDYLQNLSLDSPFYLYVSHFYSYKNHMRLIEAYNSLPSTIKDNKKLVLVGKFEDISYVGKIKKMIFSYNLEDKVLLIPGLDKDHLKVLYQSAELFIFPSLVENCPNILLEAMAAGAPIVSADIAPMTEYCQGAAVYFNGLDTKSITNAIQELHLDNIKLEKMRILSKKRSESYSWDNFVNAIIFETKKIILLSLKKNT